MSSSLVLTRREAIGREGLIVAGTVLATALCAQISIPFEPVPFTLQTFAVTLSGLLLGAKRAALGQLSYLAVGAAGLPVFANGMAGPQVLFGTTGGYLVAFVLAAALLGALKDRGWTKAWQSILGLVAANAAILGVGALWLSRYVGPSAAVTLGVLPFITGAAIKSLAVMVAVPALGANRTAEPD